MYASRQIGIEYVSGLFNESNSPDSLLHILVPVVESIRHLPTVMAVSGMLVQDKGVNIALGELFKSTSTIRRSIQ